MPLSTSEQAHAAHPEYFHLPTYTFPFPNACTLLYTLFRYSAIYSKDAHKGRPGNCRHPDQATFSTFFMNQHAATTQPSIVGTPLAGVLATAGISATSRRRK